MFNDRKTPELQSFTDGISIVFIAWAHKVAEQTSLHTMYAKANKINVLFCVIARQTTHPMSSSAITSPRYTLIADKFKLFKWLNTKTRLIVNPNDSVRKYLHLLLLLLGVLDFVWIVFCFERKCYIYFHKTTFVFEFICVVTMYVRLNNVKPCMGKSPPIWFTEWQR